MAETVIMDGTTLSCAGVAAVARGGARVAVAPEGLARAAAAHQAALEAAARSPFYGRTTGVGANGMMAVDPGNGHGLRLVRSHVGGSGERADGAVARGMLAVRLNQLAAGGSGAAPVWLEATAMALNEGLTPVFSVLGGIGTADLAGLAAAALALIGERPWLAAIPKHAVMRTVRPATWNGVANISIRIRSASSAALTAEHPGKAARNSSLPTRPNRS